MRRLEPYAKALVIAIVIPTLAFVFSLFSHPLSATASQPSVKGGKFEVTCKPGAHPDIAEDAIVSPGVPSMHMHTFFGSKDVNSSSTPASLQSGISGTTCTINQDHAAYWIPTACFGPCVDINGNPTMGMQNQSGIVNKVQPVKIFAYYFGVPISQATEAQYPTDIQLVGGNAHAASPSEEVGVKFSCGNGGKHKSPNRTYPYDCTAANGVSGTDGVVAIVNMPYCQTVGAPTSDYHSYVYPPSTGVCPAGTVTLGDVQIHAHYGLNATGFQTGSKLNFSSGPYYTFHGDWQNGWDQTKLAALVRGCLNVDKDCGFLTKTNPGPS